MRLLSHFAPLATLALAAALSTPATAQTATLEPTNLGPMRENIFTGHKLTPLTTMGPKAASDRILYAPSEADDPTLRAAISAAAGGATVDYFDARNATPAPGLVVTYDAIYTWANFAYFDNVAFGNLLATASDNGIHVVLGSFCTYTSGNFLSGAIMTSAYAPVISPTGTNHFSASPYAGDGVTCIYNGVNTLDSIYRDILSLQGNGVTDGTCLDGEISHAYRPLPGTGGGAIVYQNGAGASALGGSGDWAIAVANAVTCLPGANPGTCTSRIGVTGLNPSGYNCVNAPSAGATWNTTIDTVPTAGTTTIGTVLAIGLSGPINNVILFGYEMLTLPPYLINNGLGSHSLPIPGGTSGIGLSTQGVRIEADSTGAVFIVLLNAQDVVIG